MNRKLALTIAIFLAVVGIAMLAGENTAMARGSCGCHCAPACDAGCHGCNACNACHSCHRQGLLARLRARRAARRCCRKACHGCHGCHASCHGCNACHGCSGGGEAAEEAAPEAEAPAPEDAAAVRTPFGFRQVTFRR